MLSRRQEDERKPPIAVLIGSLLTNRRYCPGTKGRKINERAPHRHTREGGYVVGAGFKPAPTSGFRVALAIASLPGMTPKLFNGFQEPDVTLCRLARLRQVLSHRKRQS
jgi:hypothetical protein